MEARLRTVSDAPAAAPTRGSGARALLENNPGALRRRVT